MQHLDTSGLHSWFQRLKAAPCIDDPSFVGANGSCLELERAGLCYDGKYNANATRAAASCCACGRDGQREQCWLHDWSNAEMIAAHKMAVESLVRRAYVIRSVRLHPSDSGYDLSRFRRSADRIALESQRFILAWALAMERLMFLSACARVCDAALPMVDVYQDSVAELRRSATIDLSEGKLDAPADLARSACRKEIDFKVFFEVVIRWSAFVGFITLYNQATIWNAYFELSRDRGGAYFFANPAFMTTTRRWHVLEQLLDWKGCRQRKCDVVEVGVFAAQTSVHVLSRFPLLHLHGVDPYLAFEDQPNADEQVYAVARDLYQGYDSRATLHRNTSRAVAPNLGSHMLDLVFIDGSHLFENALDDMRVWASKTRVIAGHDLSIADTAVARAIRACFPTHMVHILPDGMWYIDLIKN